MALFKRVTLSFCLSLFAYASSYSISLPDKIIQINQELAHNSASSQIINDRINFVTQALNNLSDYIEQQIPTMHTICSKYSFEDKLFRNLENTLNFRLLTNIQDNIDASYQNLSDSIERLNRLFQSKKARRQDIAALNSFKTRVEQSLHFLRIDQRNFEYELRNQHQDIRGEFNALEILTRARRQNAEGSFIENSYRLNEQYQINQELQRRNELLQNMLQVLQRAE